MLQIYQNSYGKLSASNLTTKLDGIIEVDELYIKAGRERKNYHIVCELPI
jgi:hypothetical protein